MDATASIVRKRGAGAGPGHARGVIRVVRPVTPAIEVVAERASVVIGLAADDVRDVLEEDPTALAAIAGSDSRRYCYWSEHERGPV